MMQFTKSGGKLIDYKLESFGDLSSEYDLIINCTGLGAKYLCNDHKVAPIRGQVFKVIFFIFLSYLINIISENF